jgi:hypothetical protein
MKGTQFKTAYHMELEEAAKSNFDDDAIRMSDSAPLKCHGM